MRFYQEITLIRNADIDRHFLLSKVFQQIHLGLVEVQDAQKRVLIGISFPEYKIGEKFGILGNKFRLFSADEDALTQFDVTWRLSRLSDYVHCTSIRPVPEKLIGYATYQRLRPKINKERLARRYARRHSLDFETALNGVVELRDDPPGGVYLKSFRYCDLPDKRITAPFIRLQSLSNGQTYCLWIKKTMTPEVASACFSSYGLSTTATVPEF